MWDTWIGASFRMWLPARMEYSKASGSLMAVGLSIWGIWSTTDAWGSAAGRAIMVSGIGTIIIPLAQAYEAAGLKMPEKK